MRVCTTPWAGTCSMLCSTSPILILPATLLTKRLASGPLAATISAWIFPAFFVPEMSLVKATISLSLENT